MRVVSHAERKYGKWIMAAWIKCTDNSGGVMWLNLDHATRMFRHRKDLTRVVFPGHEDDFLDVKEEPSNLISMAKLARAQI